MRLVRNQKGIALLFAMFMVVMISFVVMEVTYETTVEYAVNAGAVSRLKAHYAAQSALDLSLLRIKIFSQVNQTLGASVPPDRKKMLDLIWSFPFSWPPQMPAELNEMDQAAIESKTKEALLDANYQAVITDEGTKIDINDLNSPSQALRKATENLLLQIFVSHRTQNEDWARKNADFRPEDLINNLKDWVDSDTESADGSGAENSKYQNLELPDGITYPPNRAFRSIEELNLVAGMTPELFDLLKNRLTLFGLKAINPNTVSSDILKSLDPGMTQEIVTEIINRRQDPNQPSFVSAEEFWNFANSKGGQFDVAAKIKDIPMVFTSAANFKIRAVGIHGNNTKVIEAIVFDPSLVAQNIAKQEIKDRQQGQGNENESGGGSQQNQNQNQTSTSTSPPSKGAPRIVYYSEE